MRLFIAIDINKKIKNSLSGLQRQIQEQVDIKENYVKWANTENIHLTLKFLGEVKDKDVPVLCDIVKDITGRFKGFELDIGKLGCFGGKSARVLWVGTGAGSEKLCELANELEEHLADAGWHKENRKYAGHLTLCRIKNTKAGFEFANICSDYEDFKAGTVAVDSVKIYQSQLMPTGPVYTVVGNFKLQ